MPSQSDSVYSPAEHRVISSWLGIEPLEPAAPTLTLSRAIQSLGIRTPTHEGKRKIDAAVARIVLARFESRLPVWRGEGLPKSFRERLKMPPRGLVANKDRRVLIAPRLVCAVNWVFSGPGIPWPSWYHASFLPLYNRFVVTESQDTDEIFGYYDFAIGSFGVDEDVASGCELVLAAEWRRKVAANHQEEWLSFDNEGVVSSKRARVLRGVIWRKQTERHANLEAELEDCVAERRNGSPALMNALVDHAKTAWLEKYDPRHERLREQFEYVEGVFNSTRGIPLGKQVDAFAFRIFPNSPSPAVSAAIQAVGADYWKLVEREQGLRGEIAEILRPEREAKELRQREEAAKTAAERERMRPFVDLADAAEWPKLGGMNAVWPNGLKRNKIAEYARAYYEEHGHLPTGVHKVGSMSVGFPLPDGKP